MTKISQAKAKLLVEYPLFGTIASRLELVVNDDIESFKSDGIKLQYNSDYIQKLSVDEIEFMFANGAMHASLAHEMRKNNRSGWLWQMATDMAINDMLVQNGLSLPDGAQYRKRFEGMYAEEIYAELKDDMIHDDIDSKLNELKEPSLSDSTEQAQQLFEEFASSVVEAEEKKGELPLHVERFFKLNDGSKIDWRDELRVAIERFYKDDYTLMPPNKKFLYMGVYLPSATSQRFRLVVAVDSSGSVDEKLLDKFLSEINFLMNIVPNYEIDLLVCDDKILSHKTFYSGDELEVELSGGGGTDFRPVFEFIAQELLDTKLLLYFTDLDGVFPKDEPSYDVKWVSSNNTNVAFGELIHLS
jgi:predicted metal-dependent peptidase